MRLLDKFGYLSVAQIAASEFDGQVAYLDKQGGAGGLAVLTADDVAAWAPLASATPPCSLVVNYEDQQGDWMNGGWGVGVQKGLWVQQQLAALGIANVPVVYFSADFHPGYSLAAVLQCLRGVQSVLGAQARGIYGFVETLDAVRTAGLADYFWLCGDQVGLQGRPWINLYQHNNDQGSVGGVVVDINDVLTPGNFGAWQPGAALAATALLVEDENMKVIQSTGRGIALVGPGYFLQLNTTDEVNAAVALYGAPFVDTDARFDILQRLSTAGAEATNKAVVDIVNNVQAIVADMHNKMSDPASGVWPVGFETHARVMAALPAAGTVLTSDQGAVLGTKLDAALTAMAAHTSAPAPAPAPVASPADVSAAVTALTDAAAHFTTLATNLTGATK